MVRRAVDWILYALHFKKRAEKPSLQSLMMDVLPTIIACSVIVGIGNSLRLPMLPLWQRMLFKLQILYRRWRMIIIGY